MTVGKSRYFWDVFWRVSAEARNFFWAFRWFLFLVFSNRSYACVRQMNKFNHQTSFWNCKAAKFCVLKWVPESVQLTRIPAHKERKCEEFYLQARLKGDIFPFDLIMRQGHLKVTFRRAISFQGLLMFSSLSSRNRDTLGTKTTGKNSLMLSTYLFRIKWVVNCLGNSRQEIDGRSCGLFLQTSVCSFTRRTRYEQEITNSLCYRGKLADKHWCFIKNNANIPNPVSVCYHSLATQFVMLSVCLCLVWN